MSDVIVLPAPKGITLRSPLYHALLRIQKVHFRDIKERFGEFFIFQVQEDDANHLALVENGDVVASIRLKTEELLQLLQGKELRYIGPLRKDYERIKDALKRVSIWLLCPYPEFRGILCRDMHIVEKPLRLEVYCEEINI